MWLYRSTYYERVEENVSLWEDVRDEIIKSALLMEEPCSYACSMCDIMCDYPIQCPDCGNKVFCNSCENKWHHQVLHKAQIWKVSYFIAIFRIWLVLHQTLM